MKIIKINEDQYTYYVYSKDVLCEGVDWNKNDDGTVDFRFNNSQTDKDNLTSGTNIDTRIFGSKQDIMNGDGTLPKVTTLQQSYITQQDLIKFYQSILDYINNGRQGEIYYNDNLSPNTRNAVKNWFKDGLDDETIYQKALRGLNDAKNKSSVVVNTYDRVNNSQDNEKIARYKTGIVPFTNIKFIALYSMQDFNISDAIKNGHIRQNDNTDKILGIKPSERKMDGNILATIPVTYDGNINPNIAHNFSQDNVGDGHQKQQFKYNDKNYSSVNQFLDKSIMYASYALKQENFSPDFIVAAPSSSKFNVYYCKNLSQKLGVPFVEDFFQRNVINVKFNKNQDTQSMLEYGLSQNDIRTYETKVKNIAYTEMGHIMTEPIQQFFRQYSHLFINIPIKPQSKEKMTLKQVYDCVTKFAFGTLVSVGKNGEKDGLSDYLCRQFMIRQEKFKRKEYDPQHAHTIITNIIEKRIGMQRFNAVLEEMKRLMANFKTQLEGIGYKIQKFTNKKFKITNLAQRFRPFLKDVYVVADKHLNNGQLLSQYANSKFLIFDEDINSGATLKLAIEALEDKLAVDGSSNILCLVNAHSDGGF